MLRVRDYPTARRFYVDTLGFEVVEEGGDPPRFGIVRRDAAYLFLDAWHGGPPPDDTGAKVWQAYLHVVEIDLLRDRLRAQGVELKVDLYTTAYGMRELELDDPDGNRLCLGADTESALDIVRNHYVLAVHDLDRTRTFYESVLGCTSEDVDPGNWVFLRTGTVTFMVGHCPDAPSPASLGDHSYFAYLVVDDIEPFAARAREHEVELIKEVRDEPWGMRELGLRTVDGHRIMLGQPLE